MYKVLQVDDSCMDLAILQKLLVQKERILNTTTIVFIILITVNLFIDLLVNDI
jgi:hypothetical protein